MTKKKVENPIASSAVEVFFVKLEDEYFLYSSLEEAKKDVQGWDVDEYEVYAAHQIGTLSPATEAVFTPLL